MKGVKESMDTEERLSKLRAEAETAKQRKLRAEMAAEAALKERDEALKALKEEYGVSSIDEAKLLVKQLENKLQADLEEAEKVLGELS